MENYQSPGAELGRSDYDVHLLFTIATRDRLAHSLCEWLQTRVRLHVPIAHGTWIFITSMCGGGKPDCYSIGPGTYHVDFQQSTLETSQSVELTQTDMRS